MNDDGSLWLPRKDAKRSKAGNLPRTQLVVAGLTHVPELNGVQYQAEDDANDSDMEETPAHVIMASEISEDPDTPPLCEVLDTLLPGVMAADLRRQSMRLSAAQGNRIMQQWALSE